MVRFLPGAFLALTGLVAGCATSKVDQPPAPPAFHAPEVGAPAARASEVPVEQTAAPGAKPEAKGAEPAQESAKAPDKDDDKGDKDKDDKDKENPPLGWIAGQPLEPEELLLEWGDIASRELFLVLDKLVASRLALAEASRLGIRLEPQAVEARYGAERKKLEEQINRGDKTRELEEFIRRDLGFEPTRYLERVRRATIRQMLAERAVRAGSLASETVKVRLIVVANGEELAKVQEALTAGRDFGEVAKELSVDDSKEDGGLVPFVVRQERSPLATLAFRTAVGEVAGPMPIGDHQFLIKVEERRAPLEGDWAAVEAAVETSLQVNPVDDAEFVNWKLTMEGRYPIDLGPLWSLIGAAR